MQDTHSLMLILSFEIGWVGIFLVHAMQCNASQIVLVNGMGTVKAVGIV